MLRFGGPKGPNILDVPHFPAIFRHRTNSVCPQIATWQSYSRPSRSYKDSLSHDVFHPASRPRRTRRAPKRCVNLYHVGWERCRQPRCFNFLIGPFCCTFLGVPQLAVTRAILSTAATTCNFVSFAHHPSKFRRAPTPLPPLHGRVRQAFPNPSRIGCRASGR